LAACNDDASASAHSSHVRALAVEAGQIYYVIIEGYNGETGNFELTFDDASGWKWWGPSRVNGGGLPPWRWQSAMAYDSARARAVVFGGSVYQGVPVGAMNDTWEWDGNQWWERSPSHQPENRGAPAMAYDRERGVMVLFGGLGESASLDDTWLWDGDDWLEQSPSREPPAMYGGAMVFDTRRGVTVLFGGFGLAGALAQTWEWDGSDWQNVTPSGDSPAPRLGAAMVYDEQRGVTVLFGGNDSSNWYNDTWEWDGNRWLELHPSSSPDERSHGAFAYDKHRGVAILFGGERDDGGQPLTLGETWEWDGSDWRRVPAASIGEPVEVTGAPMVYDEMNREMMLFQGAQYVRSEGARYIVPYAWFYSTCRTGG
jgi:hypothetical protein